MAGAPDDRGSGIDLPTAKEPLEQLFVRCHRDELLPLAELLSVPTEGVGLGLLGRNLARAARRLVRHGLLNAVLSGGDGPPWPDVLASLTGRRLVGWDEMAEVEVEIVREATAEAWPALPAEERRALWSRLRLEGDPPLEGAEAMAAAQRELGGSFGYLLTQARDQVHGRRHSAWLTLALLSPLGCICRPIFFAIFLAGAVGAMRSDRKRLVTVVIHVARLRQIVLHRITIGLVGSPSTGKDAGIKALFGIDSGNISPIAGSTRTVNIQRVPGATALYVVNTPGLGDVVQQVTDEAKQILSHIDVYLYVVNAEGGVQARELADYTACKDSGKPVLALVNKIDLLRPRDKDRYLADARSKLGSAEADFLPVAFDPMPELAPGPIGLEPVREWLVRALTEAGKDPAELPPLPTPVARVAEPDAALEPPPAD